ncbi:hypothetical protein [uncultured Halomonas sp.]|uniref:hypothetical protein n=1 Tax=uncultured Halomonas sp. TaxID=173971 RepID=UPI0026372AC5|nr:hypothetical protein [uncultured Halomonas sp.]
MGWSRSLAGFADEVEATLGERQKQMVIFALQQLIQHSPVDSGAYRGSHFVTLNRRDNITVPESGPDEALRRAEMVLDAAMGQPFKRVYIQSNIAYGERIENGWSQQAPGGVYAVATNSTRERFR